MQRQTPTVTPGQPLADIVRANYRTADVLSRLGIRVDCNDSRTLQQACSQQGLSVEEAERALQPVYYVTAVNNLQYHQWKPDFLIDYLVNIHHAYLNQSLPELAASLAEFASNHRLPDLDGARIQQVFQRLQEKLQQHNHMEETAIFPYLKQMINAYNRKESYGALFVKTMRKPLQQLLDKEYQQIDELMQQLRAATRHYRIPPGACAHHGVLMQKLAELDNDLLQQKHLKKNILLPKVLQMEKELLQL